MMTESMLFGIGIDALALHYFALLGVKLNIEEYNVVNTLYVHV